MRCGDLERYLEAFLDGRLDRGRRIVLRRHLSLCGACQTRVERLRQFERETQRRFRALEEPSSVWEGSRARPGRQPGASRGTGCSRCRVLRQRGRGSIGCRPVPSPPTYSRAVRALTQGIRPCCRFATGRRGVDRDGDWIGLPAGPG